MHTITIGDDRITVEHTGEYVEPGPWRETAPVYTYTIKTEHWEYVGNDLKGPLSGRVPPEDEMMGALLCFLEASADAYRSNAFREVESENLNLFPPHVCEWAYINETEIELAHEEVAESWRDGS